LSNQTYLTLNSNHLINVDNLGKVQQFLVMENSVLVFKITCWQETSTSDPI